MAHAEIAQIWPRDGRLRFVGRLHGVRTSAARADAWRLLLVPRGDSEARDEEGQEEHALRYPAPLDGESGDRFDVSLPVTDLLADGVPLPAQWDLYLTRDAGSDAPGDGEGERLRLAKLLDDIKGKKKIMVFPAQSAAAPTGKALVKPYYTVHDRLSVECLPDES
ncbi:hypothetical protein ACTWP5_07405 [Streptomyces sp. 4N509B]|uniref:hypothetical protein n=1 Tax=Streptomyces sp. 4N509B TaxID=3457413 RepID=UPI003FCEEE39